MADNNEIDNDIDYAGTFAELDRRRMLRRASLGVGMAAMAATGVLGSSTPAKATNQGAGPPDVDIFNFALNLEYLEAEFYAFATSGKGLPANMRTGVGYQGGVNPGMAVPFTSSAIAQYAAKIAVDEVTHVNFIRQTLGSAAVAEPTIDVGVGPNNAFTTLAIAAGLIVPGQVFNPYANDLSFLLAAAVFEDVGVTAYAGAARFIGNPDYLEAAAGILAVEAYHAGTLRTLLANLGAGAAFGQIANLRGQLSSAGGNGAAEQPILFSPTESFNSIPADANSLAFRRTTRQVLNIVYGAAGASSGLFFPTGLSGNIRS